MSLWMDSQLQMRTSHLHRLFSGLRCSNLHRRRLRWIRSLLSVVGNSGTLKATFAGILFMKGKTRLDVGAAGMEHLSKMKEPPPLPPPHLSKALQQFPLSQHK